MKLKQNLLAIVIVATATAPVLAETSDPLPAANEFTTTEMALLFEPGAQLRQLVALSDQEMKTTEGAWGPWGTAIGVATNYLR